MRLLGLDYGSRTVGVAVTDELNITAMPLMTITRERENKLRRTLAQIDSLVSEYDISTIVLGHPLNMDDSEGERARKTETFRDLLIRRTHLPVVLWDERLTTVEADEILGRSGVRPEERKTVIDQVAAALILESYMREKGI